MVRDEIQFHLRLPPELHAKIKQKAKMNRRSINTEIVATMAESLAQPSPILGYRDEAERLASMQAEEFKKIVFETLKAMYGDKK
ncbi:Arc family DNA-binding protein [Symbiopectobacterium purcellii]|uniref:Arc family DNA-binding protein n=1 Tax=Symbiopectobacterium purcellii TaxID=2871826 RepID=A0ABX9AXV8_9ENTR|nr:Arc family DNA-binding protein [Symbiopectobacterium purcellii]QZN97775.1 Arc family DNA-binding protein [Symbiopectobacterium purcellii]